MPGSEELRTRTRLRTAVAELGPVTAGALATQLGLTSAAVRRHLDALTAEGVVETREPSPAQRRGRGRPAREYVVSSAGHDTLPAGYDDLALTALAYLAEVQGPAAVQDFAERRLAGLEERLSTAVAAAGPGTGERVAALAAALAAQGYAASARPVARGTAAEGTQLCQGHCPVRRAAEAFPELCEAEAKVFERVLGTRVQRLATLARGAHVCTTYVPSDHHPPDRLPARAAHDSPDRVTDPAPGATTSTSTTLDGTTAGTATPTEGRRR
ncbi:helix-turn-helix transcriptional regulator [Kineococcus siccus]|uniref:helix-turn-helix transcriptional regulator n=1 Tax=Kineococcus siccus TaxID=2696567 RepID=UPI0030B817E0